jgi:flagellar hook-length control protein FliK
MGPVSIRIDINQDQATIAFMAQNANVRDALEASIPKLREMLSTQQLNLADVSVSPQTNSNTDGRSQQFNQQMGDAAMNSSGNQRNNPTLDVNGNVIASTDNREIENIENAQVIGDNGTNGLLSIYA